MSRHLVAAVAAVFAFSTCAVAFADHELPPNGSMPLSTLIKALENQQAGVVTKAHYDDQQWMFHIVRDGKESKIGVDPKNGEERSREALNEATEALPPKDQAVLSQIVKKIEDQQKGQIVSLDFEDGVWNAKLVNNGEEAKVSADAKGNVLTE
jgi:hypothetical protein